MYFLIAFAEWMERRSLLELQYEHNEDDVLDPAGNNLSIRAEGILCSPSEIELNLKRLCLLSLSAREHLLVTAFAQPQISCMARSM